MRTLFLIALLATSPLAFADSYRFDKGVIMDGDSIAKLIDRAGKPDRVVQLENRYGGAVAERWEYYLGDKLVAFIVRGGQVVAIEETR